jgi:Na+/melibiose symporter-like transporter
MFHAVGATLNNRSFIALLMVGVLMSVANGARLALELYYNVYFWQLPQTQLSVLLLATIVGILPGVTLAPLLARRLGKRQLVTIVIIGGIVGNVGPVLGRLAGVMPANGTPTLFAILFADVAFTFCMATMTTIMLTSMMNDVVEDVEVKTGRRSEGLLLAADSFFKKLVSSVGVFVSGVMLTVIGFPQHAVRGKVAPEIVVKLAYGYLPITALYLIAFCLLSFYQIDRAKHESNLALLKRRAQAP